MYIEKYLSQENSAVTIYKVKQHILRLLRAPSIIDGRGFKSHWREEWFFAFYDLPSSNLCHIMIFFCCFSFFVFFVSVSDILHTFT